ncbi:DUF1624 domain-containing protein [Flavobacterium sp. Sd200]|uniref:DUF1624 domain-containing protein n=1 Tax=Flavobacterium sp. Sd200 TaxID=2692211 RepID=UPI00136BA7F7|nr:heparan-alpha-glucosaminide N-acetyltransferase domain-containing protein [Flavobacterium sp. Sd200]MXN92484.1 DUF1624 domain-containing protein [Flavobacterium sp. Sd200]
METVTRRIQSIDVLRGIIMAIMALDHTRDYFHINAMSQDPTDLETTTPLLFFTRWITHFCAPTFVFLSGTSIYLQSLRKTKKELGWFLLTRGLWLVVAEFTIVGFGWSFDPFFSFQFLQVMWAIGCSMIIMSGLVFFSYRTLAVLGILITLLHNLMDFIVVTDPEINSTLNVFLITEFKVYSLLGLKVMFAYAILPWTGIMLLGYAAGKWYNTKKVTFEQRRKFLLTSGFGLIGLFAALRLINLYGDLQPWSNQPTITYTVLSFFNVTKYPPSLQYACMTLGVALLALAFIENINNRFTAIMNVFGRVPFFYYLLHIYIIHLLCVGLYFIEGYTIADLFTKPMAFGFRPRQDFGLELGYVYLVWLLVLVLCYYPSRWYNNYKSTHTQWWLGYI